MEGVKCSARELRGWKTYSTLREDRASTQTASTPVRFAHAPSSTGSARRGSEAGPKESMPNVAGRGDYAAPAQHAPCTTRIFQVPGGKIT